MQNSESYSECQHFPVVWKGDRAHATDKDSNGNALAVTPGSALWTITQTNTPSNTPQINRSGHVLPSYPESAQVTVTVDGKTSDVAAVSVVRTEKYTITPLPALASFQIAHVYGLNAAGYVVGSSESVFQEALMWYPGGANVNLGFLAGD